MMEAKHLPDNPLSRFLLLILLPFSYGAATRVPFVFASLHTVWVLGASLPTLAGVLGCYQVFRILGNYFVGALGPHIALPCGAAAGLVGYGILATATAVAPAAVGPGALAACLALVGLSETITALQFFCKKTYGADPEHSQHLRGNLLRLYACNVAGTCVAFLGSALLYHTHGITGAACFGAGFEAALLLGTLVYLGQCAARQRAEQRQAHDASATAAEALTQHLHANGTHTHPFGAVAHEQGPPEGTLRATQAEAGLGADPIVLQLSRSMSLHSQELCRSDGDASFGSSLGWISQLLGDSFITRAQAPSGSLAIPVEGIALVADSSGHMPPVIKEGSKVSFPPSRHSSETGAPPALLTARRLHSHQALGGSFTIPEESTACAADGTGRTPGPPASRRGSKASLASSRPSSLRQPSNRPGAAAQDDAPWINHVLAWTFCVQAVLIGTILSTAPLLLHDSLGLGVLHVGFAFSAGEALGSVALIFNSTQVGRALVRRVMPLPLGLLWVLCCMGLLAMSLPLCVRPTAALINLILIMGFNDVGTSMTGECQGAALPERHYTKMNVLGNMLRRFGNTITCALGPLIYQLHPRAPFVMFGALLLAWALLLTVLVALRAQQVGRGDGDAGCHSAGSTLRACKKAYWTRGRLASIGADLGRYRDQSFISQERKYWSGLVTRLSGRVSSGLIRLVGKKAA